MADSYLLKSQEQTTPFEMSQVESARQQGAAPVQAGLQAFQGMQENNRQNIATYLAMEESKRRNAENATMVALEEAKRQDYVAKMQAFQMELATRMQVNQLKVQDMMVEKQRNELKLEQETNEMPEGIYGKPYQLPNGEVGRLMPTPGKKRSVWSPLGPDERKAWDQEQKSKVIKSSHEAALAKQAEYETTDDYRWAVEGKAIGSILAGMEKTGASPEDMKRMQTYAEEHLKRKFQRNVSDGELNDVRNRLGTDEGSQPTPVASRPPPRASGDPKIDSYAILDNLKGPQREAIVSLATDKDLGGKDAVYSFIADRVAEANGLEPSIVIDHILGNPNLKKWIKESRK